MRTTTLRDLTENAKQFGNIVKLARKKIGECKPSTGVVTDSDQNLKDSSRSSEIDLPMPKI